MIYGANGYTGRLIVDRAVKRGFRPVLAGRNAREIRMLARHYVLLILGCLLVAEIL